MIMILFAIIVLVILGHYINTQFFRKGDNLVITNLYVNYQQERLRAVTVPCHSSTCPYFL